MIIMGLFGVMFNVQGRVCFVLIELRTHTRASPLRAPSFIAHHQLCLLSKMTHPTSAWGRRQDRILFIPRTDLDNLDPYVPL